MLEINQIYKGDCLELMKSIPDGSIDAIITDLPYGTTSCSWDSVIPFDELWEAYNRICKPTAPIVLFGSQPFTSVMIASNIKCFREELCWLKNKPATGFGKDQRHMKIHENIVIFSKQGGYTFNPQKWLVEEKEFLTQRKTFKENEYIGNNIYGATTRTRRGDDATRYPISIVSASTPHAPSYSKTYDMQKNDIRQHPTQKPLSLIQYLIRTYTNEGETVLDSCCGSGTTAIAAIREKRNFICIEKDPHYYEVAKKRIETELSQPKLFLIMTERDFFQQIWRAYDTVTFDGNIKAQVVNVCFPTRSVCVSMPNKIKEWVNCERIDKHTTRPNEPSNEDQVVENILKELSGADEKMKRQALEIERLKATLSQLQETSEIRLANLLSETKHDIALLNEGLTIKKSKLEQVEKGLQTINDLCDSLRSIYNEVKHE